MSAPKFTPGPYVVDEDGDADQAMPHPDWTAVGLADADGFAEVVAYCHPDNAPLLAAAPDLYATGREAYEALHDIINAAQGDDPYSAEDLDRLFSDIAGHLFEALRKAEGAS